MFDRNKDKQSSKETVGTAPVAKPAPVPPAASAAGSARRAIIGSTVRISGDVSGDEDLLIEGFVEGTVSLPEHELLVGESGKVHADLTAKVVRVAGEVQGDIIGRDKVIVASTSNISGNIMTPRMTLEEGARFKGCIDIDPQAGQAAASATGTREKPPTGNTQHSAQASKAPTPPTQSLTPPKPPSVASGGGAGPDKSGGNK
jgi:cytoskeletal protein CcmA (bactofilin family)